MLQRATLLAAFGLLLALPAAAQDAPPLGDEFIFFVEGINPAVPSASAAAVADPSDPDDTVLQFGGGNFAGPALTWPAATGVDLSANQANRDSIFFELRMGPGTYTDTDTANVYFMLLDSQDLNNDGDFTNDDVPFRLIWPVPARYFDGEVHQIVLPLPPATVAELEAAKGDTTVSGEALPPEQRLSEDAKLWTYQGGYNPDGDQFIEPSFAEFMEFDYANVFSFGFFWDQGAGPAGNVFVDDFYIGSENTDLSAATGAGQPYAGQVTATVEGDAVVVSFTAQEGAGAYNLYAVTDDGADVTDPEQALLLRRFTGDDELALSYALHSPAPSVPDPQITFAVTVDNENGIENTTPVYRTFTFEDAPPFGYAFGMTESELDGLFGAFEDQTFDVGFLDLDEKVPFRIGPDNGTAATPNDGTVSTVAPIDDAADLTAEVYIGWAADPDFPDETILMLYADVTDDAIRFAPDDGLGAPSDTEPFRYDRLALFYGTYEVPFPVGSNHGGLIAGEDYALNVQPLVDSEGNVTTVATLGYTPDVFGQPLFERKSDGSGWRVLTAFLLGEVTLADGDERSAFARPDDAEVGYFPLIIGLDEQDGDGRAFTTRNNVVSSERPNVNFASPGWFSSPLQWTPVAFVGSAVTTSTGETGLARFGLDAPFPNPAAGSATVRFRLDEAAHARLDVFDLLGRRVQTVQSERASAGEHTATVDADGLSAGVYFVRLTAGERSATQRLVVLR